MPLDKRRPYKTFYAKCKCRKYVACAFTNWEIGNMAQRHANICNNKVIVGECPPNAVFADKIFHYCIYDPRPQ